MGASSLASSSALYMTGLLKIRPLPQLPSSLPAFFSNILCILVFSFVYSLSLYVLGARRGGICICFVHC